MTTRSFFADYLDTESEFREAEASGTLTPKREDDLTDRLARLWWKLTDDEQKSVEQIAGGEVADAPAAAIFDLVDRPVARKQKIAPRQAA